MKKIIVLRYGHRKKRDYRVTTHCCLVARAFNAKEIIISGEEDKALIETINEMQKKWGNAIKISFTNSWEKELKKFKEKGYKAIHLTMYGENINTAIKKIKGNKFLVIIGSKKVEKKVYDLADYNIAIGNQPHSEIAALAIFLDRIFKGKELTIKPKNQKIIIKGNIKGKKIVKKRK
jgi:tRNA (cytidine56-2'-O)-methyltransferase